MKNQTNENGDRMSRADVCAGVLFWALALGWLGLVLGKAVAG